jgi:lipid-binding SYLF domain-containing protein
MTGILFLSRCRSNFAGGPMKKAFPLLMMLLGASSLFAASEANDRMVRAAIVLREIAETPDNSIPKDLLDKSACVAVIPGVKGGGFIFGGNYGKGVVSCRTENGMGPWSAPSMIMLGNASFGLQIGAKSVDLILVVMNISGLESLLDSKFTLGGDVTVAAGPVGRTASAETDAWLTAKILAYSRSVGIFGGLVLKGGVIRPDKDSNIIIYGKEIQPRAILFNQSESVPKDVQIFLDELTKFSPKRVEK